MIDWNRLTGRNDIRIGLGRGLLPRECSIHGCFRLVKDIYTVLPNVPKTGVLPAVSQVSITVDIIGRNLESDPEHFLPAAGEGRNI